MGCRSTITSLIASLVLIAGILAPAVVGSTSASADSSIGTTCTRSRLASLAGLTVSLVAFFTVVVATNRNITWEWAARVFPWAPLWRAIHQTHDEFWLSMSGRAIIIVVGAWLLVAAVASWFATRPARSR